MPERVAQGCLNEPSIKSDLDIFGGILAFLVLFINWVVILRNHYWHTNGLGQHDDRGANAYAVWQKCCPAVRWLSRVHWVIACMFLDFDRGTSPVHTSSRRGTCYVPDRDWYSNWPAEL